MKELIEKYSVSITVFVLVWTSGFFYSMGAKDMANMITGGALAYLTKETSKKKSTSEE